MRLRQRSRYAGSCGKTQELTRRGRITSISKFLERIADHATNIAERVVFMVEGKGIRPSTV